MVSRLRGRFPRRRPASLLPAALLIVVFLILPALVGQLGWVAAAPVGESPASLPAEFPSGRPLQAGDAGHPVPFPTPNAAAFIIMDRSTGQVLAAGSPDLSLPMASTTKVLTALLLIENNAPETVMWVPFETRGVEGSKLFLEPGERYTAEELLVALMIASANDAAVTVAVNMAGSVDAFADMMNERARTLGLTKSHFVNPHGLHADDHYASARDLGRLVSAALDQPRFRQAAAMTTGTISDPIRGSTREINSHNLFLVRYEDARGVKTGFTSEAGFCLVAVTEREGRQMVGVILGGPSSQAVAADMKKMMDWAWDGFEPTVAVAAGIPVTALVPGERRESRWQTAASVVVLQPSGGKGQPQIETKVEIGAEGDSTARLTVQGPGGLALSAPLVPAGSVALAGTGGDGADAAAGLVKKVFHQVSGTFWPLWALMMVGTITMFRWRRQRRRRYIWRRTPR